MQTLNRIWEYVRSLPRIVWEVLVVVISLVANLWYNKQRREAEVRAQAAEADKANAVLKQKQEDIKKEDSQVVRDGEEKKAEVPNKTPEELAKDLNNV